MGKGQAGIGILYPRGTFSSLPTLLLFALRPGTVIRVTVTAGSEWMANPDKVLLAGGLPGGPAPCSATTPRGSHTTGGRRATPRQRSGSTLGRRRSGTGAHLAVPGNAPVAAAGSAHRAAPCSTAACCPCSSASCATRSTSTACALRQDWAPGQCDSASRRYENLRKPCHEICLPAWLHLMNGAC